MALLHIRFLAGPTLRVGASISLTSDTKTFPKYCMYLQIFALIISCPIK